MSKVYCVFERECYGVSSLFKIAKDENTANRVIEERIQHYIDYGNLLNLNPITCESLAGHKCVIHHYSENDIIVKEVYFKEQDVIENEGV